MAERINQSNFQGKVLEEPGLVLVDFYSDSCVPCKKLAPALGELEDEHEGELKIYKVNTNYDEEIAAQYNVKGTPTLLLFRNGQIADRKVGALSQDDLFDWVENYIR
ncbi:MAG: thioredoxin fold domain-containing protein [Lachnospiraceae bacterium]|nr:thioredoxin fold domain-containing protein [Lachnospiraceae bacterium]